MVQGHCHVHAVASQGLGHMAGAQQMLNSLPEEQRARCDGCHCHCHSGTQSVSQPTALAGNYSDGTVLHRYSLAERFAVLTELLGRDDLWERPNAPLHVGRRVSSA